MSNEKPFRGRLLLVGAVTALALSVGGVAYAVTGDEAGADAGYVQIVDGDQAPDRTAQDPARDSAQEGDRWDCPDKRGGNGDGDNGDNGDGNGGNGGDAGANAQNAADQL